MQSQGSKALILFLGQDYKYGYDYEQGFSKTNILMYYRKMSWKNLINRF